MLNLKSVFRPVMPLVAILLLGIAFCPAADLQTATTTVHTTQAAAGQEAASQTAAPHTSRQKSVLDEEVLDSPIAFLKEAFSTTEEDTDVTTEPSTLVLTVKALIATLLSTII